MRDEVWRVGAAIYKHHPVDIWMASRRKYGGLRVLERVMIGVDIFKRTSMDTSWSSILAQYVMRTPYFNAILSDSSYLLEITLSEFANSKSSPADPPMYLDL